MKVKILIAFDVEPVDDPDNDFTENHAKSAASQAAYDYLSFTKVSGHSTDCDSVEVFADGFGPCNVSIGEDHD
jgi:hypothetical protein